MSAYMCGCLRIVTIVSRRHGMTHVRHHDAKLREADRDLVHEQRVREAQRRVPDGRGALVEKDRQAVTLGEPVDAQRRGPSGSNIW